MVAQDVSAHLEAVEGAVVLYKEVFLLADWEVVTKLEEESMSDNIMILSAW